MSMLTCRWVTGSIAGGLLAVAAGSIAAAEAPDRNNTAGDRGIPTTTWPAGTHLATIDTGGRQATFHRGWLYLLCTGVDNNGPNTVFNIADPTTPQLVDSRPVGGNGHRFFHVGDLFSRGFSVPEIAILADEDKQLPDGSISRFLDLSDVPDRIAYLDQDALPFPLDKNAGAALDWPYRFRDDGIQDYNTGDQLSTIDWAAEAGIPERGQSLLVGNIYIVSGAQKGGGPVAAYDIGDPTNPQLLDVLPVDLNAYVGGNVQVYGHHFMVLGRASIVDGQTYNSVGIDFSDPTDLKVSWAYESSQMSGRYMEFQDHYGFSRGRKIDMDRVLAGEAEVGVVDFDPRGGDFVWLPVGHLVVSSASGHNGPGTTEIYAHQDGLDTTPPSVAYHFPADGASNLPITSNIGLVIHETLDASTVVPGAIEVRPVGGAPIEILVVNYDYDVVHIAPIGDLAPNTTYEVVINDGQVLDAAGNAMAGYQFSFSTGDPGNESPVIAAPQLTPASPVQTGTTVDLTVSATDPEAGPLEYRWDFGDGSGRVRSRTAWSTDPDAQHTYASAGNYTVVVQVRDDHGHIVAATTQVVVTAPVPATAPRQSGTLAIDETRRVVWVCDPDNDQVTRIDADTRLVIGSPTVVGDHPAAIMVADDGAAWVVNRDDDTLMRIASDGTLVQTVELGYGTRPVALVDDPVRADTAYLAEAGTGVVRVIDTSNGSERERLTLASDDGSGVRAVFYDDSDFGDAFVADVVATVDEDWGTDAPRAGMTHSDAFTVRYLAHLTPLYDETYTFTISTWDDATRMWIDGAIVIDDWNGRFGKTTSGEIALEAGRSYEVMIEMLDRGDRARVTLEWESASQAQEVVPASAWRQPGVRQPRPRALAISADGNSLLVSQFLSPDHGGHVWRLDLAAATSDRFVLSLDATTIDGTANGRGVPNQLTGLSMSPQGDRAWATGVKANIQRGVLRDDQGLDFETTLRAMLAPLDLATGAETSGLRMDIDDHGFPYAVTYSPSGNHIFASLQDSQRVMAFNARSGGEVARSDVGIAPQALAVDASTGWLWVHDFLSRQVTVLDVGGTMDRNESTMPVLGQVALNNSEALSAEVLRGKQLFYSARDSDSPTANPSRMTQDNYISCAACHLDGGHDGRTWDFTGRGEGLRNTITLRGRRGTGHGPVHWSGNFDEIQDFELDIVNHFGGTGFLEGEGGPHQALATANAGRDADLDALAAYVTSLDAVPRSPNRVADGTKTTAAAAGRQLFGELNCASCHSGSDFTDSALDVRHDIGTLRPSSGNRLGEELDGIDTPSLKGLWATAPYLHDGSAPTLEAVFTRSSPSTVHGRVQELTAEEQAQLISFLMQIDQSEAAVTGGGAPALLGITLRLSGRVEPGSQAVEVDGVRVQPEADGTFTITVPVTVGTTTLPVVVIDAAGEASRTVLSLSEDLWTTG